MELSLFSRDVIAMATAVSLCHNTFDAVLCLGVCDKIVPGLLIGALHFGHLPAIFVPGGPMTSGLANDEKAKIRQLYAQGKVGRDALLEAESQAYHGPGTCTFYGTANSNQMLMEVMGLHLPGAAFVHPNTPLRDALTQAATKRAARITALGDEYLPVGRVVDERAMVNGIIGLLATGGSTNHTLHLVAMAHAAGIAINWDDFSDLSAVAPLLAKVYPNGQADVNHTSMPPAAWASSSANCSTPGCCTATCSPWPAKVWRAIARSRFWITARWPGVRFHGRAATTACCVPPRSRSVPTAD